MVEYDDRGTFARADDVSPALSIEERVWRFEMALRYAEGKRLLGHGDERIGSRVPLLLQDLGCTVEDVRLVDRAWRALPPYLDPRERLGLETVRTMLAPPSEAAWAWAEACYRAGGAADADVDRLRRLVDEDPWRSDVLALLDRGGYRYVSAILRFVTLARTPVA